MRVNSGGMIADGCLKAVLVSDELDVSVVRGNIDMVASDLGRHGTVVKLIDHDAAGEAAFVIQAEFGVVPTDLDAAA